MGPYSGGDHAPLNVVFVDVAFTRTGGDPGRTLGRSAWTFVVIGSEWEVPPRLSALRGNVLMGVRCEVECFVHHVVRCVWMPTTEALRTRGSPRRWSVTTHGHWRIAPYRVTSTRLRPRVC